MNKNTLREKIEQLLTNDFAHLELKDLSELLELLKEIKVSDFEFK